MIAKLLHAGLVICFCAYAPTGATGIDLRQDDAAPGIVTLYPPQDKVTKRFDPTRGCFNFRLGIKSRDWDLGYSFLKIGYEDYFQVRIGGDKRSRIKDLGKYEWADSFKIPVLDPLPELMPGETRAVVVDSSAGKRGEWEKTNPYFVKAIIDHMYLVRVKDAQSDFYVLFRVENLNQGLSCIISWKRIPSPEK